tara:strand:+ start:2084 stop:2368 length:285 start_codon:yes stop_codon:yes gene_type:complete
MDEATLYTNFYIGLAIAVVIILVAAVLLILVWTSARRILKLATAALGLVVQIKENTNSIWGLQTTNEVATDILNGAEAIETHAGMVAQALHETE